MKAVQIQRYSKNIDPVLREIPIPKIADTEVLVRVKAAAVNPVELLIVTGSVRLIQDYSMPLTLGNECSGVVEQVGASVTEFQVGEAVYARLPVRALGALRSTYLFLRVPWPRCLPAVTSPLRRPSPLPG